MTLSVYLPENHIAERLYIIDFFLSHFLGISYSVNIGDYGDYILCFSNKKIVIKDDFFCNFKDNLSYLNLKSLPKVIRGNNPFSIEKDIIILYGNNAMEVGDHEIKCGIDIFSSAFFMLTRWEEYVNKKRDKHGRFEGKLSIAYNYSFLHRPIVNEYVEMLWNMMRYLGFNCKRKEREFHYIPTHDIDHFRMQHRLRKTIKAIAIDIIKRHEFKSAINRIKWFYSDPYDTISLLASISENNNLKSHFYFMAADPNIEKNIANPFLNKKAFKSTIINLIKRDHIIGFHPGYFTYQNLAQLINEKNKLDNIICKKTHEGRYHYLRLSLPESLTAFERFGIYTDSSLGYHDVEGFRCGTGDNFPFFDVEKRRKTNIIEMPLIIMDGTLFDYQHYSIHQAFDVISNYVKIAKKYKMPITLLFHNSSFAKPNGKDILNKYENMFKDN